MKRTGLKRHNPLKASKGLNSKSGFKTRKPLNKVSKKQKIENSKKTKIKRELIAEATKDDRGVPLCSDCGKPVDWDWRSKNGDLAHVTFLSAAGKNVKENGKLKCRFCHHTKDHHLKEIMDEQPQWSKNNRETMGTDNT